MSGLVLSINYTADQHFSLKLDCELPARGITAVYGPSGSGKSTLLDCIAGLRAGESGSVVKLGSTLWQGPNHLVPAWNREVGYVFQDARLFPHLNVLGNLRYALTRSRQRDTISLDQVITSLELNELLQHTTNTLSAGQKQRVAIARALLSSPALLLLDEPLANLDHAASQQCLRGLQQLSKELQLPMLYVSHDIEEVAQLADYLLLLEQGRLVEQGSLLELCSRLDTRLSREERAAAIITASVKQHDIDFDLTELDVEGHSLFVNRLSHSLGQQRRMRIPARDISICRSRPSDTSILNILPVTIDEMEHSDGARILLRLCLGSQYLLARITRKSAMELELQVGDKVFAQIKSVALLIEASDAA